MPANQAPSSNPIRSELLSLEILFPASRTTQAPVRAATGGPAHGAGSGVRLLSVSSRVQGSLRAGARGRVLSVHARACNLLLEDGRLLALVTPEIGNGPLSAVLDAGPAGWFERLAPGDPFNVHADGLWLGGQRTGVSSARRWNPRPLWPAPQQGRSFAQAALARAALLGPPSALPGALLPAFVAGTFLPPPFADPGLDRLSADPMRWLPVAQFLTGLGEGLTPAGDDALMGMLLALWLLHPQAAMISGAVFACTLGATTRLASALLLAASQGECAQAWHDWLTLAPDVDNVHWANALQSVLRHGASSGADALAGFLFACRALLNT